MTAIDRAERLWLQMIVKRKTGLCGDDFAQAAIDLMAAEIRRAQEAVAVARGKIDQELFKDRVALDWLSKPGMTKCRFDDTMAEFTLNPSAGFRSAIHCAIEKEKNHAS